MTTTEVYTVIKTWINTILNTELNKDMSTIRGEQNSPQPSKHYITMHQPMSVRQVGSGNQDQRTDDEGNLAYELHYEATLTLEEIGGCDNGDNLRLLLDSFKRQDIKDYFRQSKVSVLRSEGVTPIPQMLEHKWKLRSTLDLIILFPDEGTYQPGWIETVVWSGTYEETVN